MTSMRDPRPKGIRVPKYGLIGVISPPLSPEFSFDHETIGPSVYPAMEYVSAKLQKSKMQITLVVGRGKPDPKGHPSDLMVTPISPLQTQNWQVLEMAMTRASKKFSLGQSWTDAVRHARKKSQEENERQAKQKRQAEQSWTSTVAIHHSQNDPQTESGHQTENERGHEKARQTEQDRQTEKDLIKYSIRQHEVIFSQEGLTLLSTDRIYTLKRRMCILSCRPSHNEEQAMACCVRLLHQISTDFDGRPFSKTFFHRVYPQIELPDAQLEAVAVAYKRSHNRDAIILPPPPQVQLSAGLLSDNEAMPVPIRPEPKRTSQCTKTQPIQAPRSGRPALSLEKAIRHAPKTHMSPTDLTPITRSEWNRLPKVRRAPVTTWNPSPVVSTA